MHLEGTRLAPQFLHPPVASCGFSGLMRLFALRFRSYCMYPRLLASYCGFLHLIAASCILLRVLAASCVSRTPNERRSCCIVLRPCASSCALLHLSAAYCISRAPRRSNCILQRQLAACCVSGSAVGAASQSLGRSRNQSDAAPTALTGQHVPATSWSLRLRLKD